MKIVEVTYDSTFKTWNIMYKGNCIQFGSVFWVDQWLIDNPEYVEK